ncbi:aspartate ammonia-lyase [Streptomyces sp. NPDC005820]|uniref:aspartate ammonia-lyase n=1 Tax=Streptomyces sp. NPDC005820 TaxID=3157069 RepID=UPI0034008144
MTTTAPRTRREHDLLGDRNVPEQVYWGIHTLRALENFPLSGERVGDVPDLVRALALVKKAAALSNAGLGLLPHRTASAVTAACDRLVEGEFHDQFPVSLVQGGAGTSTNMNANEVIANVALEHLGHPCGTYTVIHPNEHVNLGQSTNDVYPTALKLAAITAAHRLIDALEHLEEAFARKAHEFSDVVKVGRTQLQDAVPMTLGQEFGTYRVMVAEDVARLREALVHLHEINLGATAIGTGLNAHPDYATAVREHLIALTGLPLATAPDLVEATQDCGAFVLLSGTVKRAAVKLSKICNDLRLLSSGPRTGLGEITLPARQAGSSIMPGKVNPVIPELVNQVAFSVIGNDTTITMAAEAGQLQLNAFEPVIASCLFRSIGHLTEAVTALSDRCIDGITANTPHLARLVDNSIATVTVLNPHIGYQAATDVATEALATGRPVTRIVRERGLLDDHTIDELLHPARLAHGALP